MYVLFGQDMYETPGISIPDATWQHIINHCEARSEIERHRNEKPYAGWICPAILKDDATSRQISDVTNVADWIGIDLDHCHMTMNELLNRYLGNTECIIYSTTNSTTSEPRWRAIIRLSRVMTPAEFMGVWKAINLLLDDNVDDSTKNVNRLHYLPAKWIGGNNEFHVQTGIKLDVDELLQCCPPEEPTFAKVSAFEQQANMVAPQDTSIITQAMIDRYDLTTSGGYFKLLCAAATRFRSQGWILHPNDLAQAASPFMPNDTNKYREAERAIDYINSKVEVLTPLQRIREEVEWKRYLKETGQHYC